MPRVKQETLNRILEHGAQLDQEVTALKTMLQMAWKTETPPIYHEVLIYITFPDEILVRPKITVGWCDDKGRWATQYGQISGVVTHWQPLPAPPEGSDGH